MQNVINTAWLRSPSEPQLCGSTGRFPREEKEISMRKRFVSTMLMALLVTGSHASDQTPRSGFRGTVNNYVIAMDPTPASCRQRNVGCSKHMNFHFRARTDGTVEMPFEMTNDDALHGFCARIHIVARDKEGNPPGNVLLDVTSAKYCIDAKAPGHERVQHVDWTIQASPDVGIQGRDLVMTIAEYDENIDFNKLKDGAVIIGQVLKLL